MICWRLFIAFMIALLCHFRVMTPSSFFCLFFHIMFFFFSEVLFILYILYASSSHYFVERVKEVVAEHDGLRRAHAHAHR